MSNEILNSLLKQYEQKKLKAEIDADRKKELLYEHIPELLQIDEQINNLAINQAKKILNSDSTSDVLDFTKQINFLKQKKEAILQQHNLTINSLKPNYECSLCNDTGYISNNVFGSKMCNCLRQKLIDISFNKSNISNLSKENFSTFNENLFSDDVDLAKYKMNISPKRNILNIKQKAINFVENFDDTSTKNLLFTGNTGLRQNFYDKLYC